jgi:hypothetical protein
MASNYMRIMSDTVQAEPEARAFSSTPIRKVGC